MASNSEEHSMDQGVPPLEAHGTESRGETRRGSGQTSPRSCMEEFRDAALASGEGAGGSVAAPTQGGSFAEQRRGSQRAREGEAAEPIRGASEEVNDGGVDQEQQRRIVGANGVRLKRAIGRSSSMLSVAARETLAARPAHKSAFLARESLLELVQRASSGEALRQAIEHSPHKVKEERNEKQETPLHIAALAKDADQVRALLQGDADVSAVDMYGNTPLHVACRLAQWDVIHLLVNAHAPLRVTNKSEQLPFDCIPTLLYRTVLEQACEHGCLVAARECLRHKEDVHHCDENGESLLHLAVRSGSKSLVHFLLEEGADPAQEDANGDPPLYKCFTVTPRLQVFNTLLKHGASVRQKSKSADCSIAACICADGDKVFLGGLIVAQLNTADKVLDFKNCHIHILHPNIITLLAGIDTIDLRDNELQALPVQLADSNVRDVLLDGNPLNSIPLRSSEPWAKFKVYLRSIANRASQWHERKLLVVGEEASGKTTLIASLKSRKGRVNVQAKNVSTNGVDVSRIALNERESMYHVTDLAKAAKRRSILSRGDSTLKARSSSEASQSAILNIWDLGGQTTFYPTHQLLLTKNSIYIVVFSVVNVQFERVEYWMRQIRSKCDNSPSAPIFLVGTHTDNEMCTPEHLESVRTQLTESYHKYAFCGLQELLFVSCRTGEGIDTLRGLLYSTIHNEKLFGSVVSSSWVNLHTTLSGRSDRYVRWSKYKHLAREHGVPPEELELATQFLASVGSIVAFHNFAMEEETAMSIPEEQEDLVVLQPQWLADVMACIVSVGHGWVKDGILSRSNLNKVFIEYKHEVHRSFVEILQRFEIVYQLGDKFDHNILVPSMLPITYDTAELNALWNPVLPKGMVEFGRVYTFPFVPIGFFNRVMVRVLHIPDVNGRLFWRDGLVIEHCASVLPAYALLTFNGSCSFNIRVRQSSDCQRRLTAGSAPNRQKKTPSLLLCLLDAVDTLIECFYRGTDNVSRLIPCTHCLKQRRSDLPLFYFSFQECMKAVTDGEPFVFCQHIRAESRAVRIDKVAPDIAFSDLAVFDDSAITYETLLGEGGFGDVYKGELTTRGGKKYTVAIKEMKRTEPVTDLSLSSSADRHALKEAQHKFEEFQKEAFVMCRLAHENLVRLYGITMNPLRMVIEFLGGGDLFNFLHPSDTEDVPRERFPWSARLALAFDIARGMQYLSCISPPILHRDLRSPNIFLHNKDCTPCTSGRDKGIVGKVGDFGLSRVATADLSGALGTWQWLAPEIITANASSTYGPKSDVYSFAMVCWEIATRGYLFEEFAAYPKYCANKPDGSRDINQIVVKTAIVEEGLRPSMPPESEEAPAAFCQLIQDCWAHDPQARPSFDDVVMRLSLMRRRDTLYGNAGPVAATGEAHESPPVPSVDEDCEHGRFLVRNLSEASLKLRTNLEADKGIELQSVFHFRKLRPLQRVFCMIIVGDYVWAGCGDGSIVVFTAADFGDFNSWRAHTSRVYSLVEVGGNVWSGSEDGYVRVWNAETRHFVAEWPAFDGKRGGAEDRERCMVKSLILVNICEDPLVQEVWTCSPHHNTLRTWDPETFQLGMFIPLPVGRLTVTEMKQHGSQVWLASEKVLIVYTAASGDLLGFFDAHDAPISCMLSLGDEIWTASSTGEIRVWAYQNEEIVSIATLKQHTARVRSMLRFKDHVITGANDTSLFVWSTKTREVKSEVKNEHTNSIHALVCKDDMIWSGSLDCTVMVWVAQHPSSGALRRRKSGRRDKAGTSGVVRRGTGGREIREARTIFDEEEW